MTRIRCRDRQCTFNKNGICTSEEIEYEPDAGCLTMEPREEAAEEEREDWEAEESDWDEEEDWDEDEDDWEDEDEEDGDEEDAGEIAPRSRKPGRR
jgi:hypothetical protein